MSEQKAKLFTPYETFMVAILAILQFTIILDFMVLSPLGAILMPTLRITTSQFGMVVSAYAFSAGASGLLAAGFADQFDRKRFLLFFYVGFLIGTVLCALATTYEFLLIARIITGIFGGVIGSVSFAIISDMFKMEVRGRVMGYVQMAFAASQILGLPIGLFLANQFDWHAPFWLIAGFGALVGVLIMVKMRPITGHLKLQTQTNAFRHLITTVSKSYYLRAFLGTILLATGGFMLMPFGSAFGTNNLGLTIEQLPVLYGITGLSSILTGPFIGKMSDKIGKFRTFAVGSMITIAMVLIYTQMGITPLWIVIALNVVLFVGISSRMISSSALMTAIPSAQDRGAFMSVNSSIQQISGGVASFVAGLIVVQMPSGKLENYDLLGYAVAGSMVGAMGLLYYLDRHVQKKARADSALLANA